MMDGRTDAFFQIAFAVHEVATVYQDVVNRRCSSDARLVVLFIRES